VLTHLRSAIEDFLFYFLKIIFLKNHTSAAVVYDLEHNKTFMKTTGIKLFALASLALTLWATPSAFAQKEKTVMVGGAAMYPSKTIVENAVNSKDHTTLVAAVKAANLVETLSGPGPFTVFAPTNEAFAKLPAGTVDRLLKPENKGTLTAVLTYHVIAGKIDGMELMKKIREGKGKAMLTTVQGGSLTFMQKGNEIWLMDAQGNKSMVTIKDVYQSNGVIHVINTVLMP
jgi:uncharacterized surface protein with fasciclin (FAS1) repeats